MDKIHTHYDNLKVTRNAPPELIRAAYKTLTQKYHPDKHPGNADAERVMALINVSYQVLSDPTQRDEHDGWIAHQEQMAAQAPGPSGSRYSAPPPTATPQRKYQQAPATPPSSVNATNDPISHVLRNWVVYGFAGLLIWLWSINTTTTPPPGPKPYQSSQAPAVPEQVPVLPEQAPAMPELAPTIPVKVRPLVAPNGQPWPVVAGYVEGYQQLHTSGLSTVTVDNSRNDSEVFVKLVSLDSAQAYPVRQFYIPAFASFTLKQVTAGSYDIRYRDLSSGGLSRSEAITLSEVHNDEGAQYSNMTMTLYKVKNGNMQTHGLAEAEF